MGGQRHAPPALPPGKTRYPLYKRLGGPQGRSGRVRKISPPTGIRFPDHPIRSKSLYRLSHSGPFQAWRDFKFIVPLTAFVTVQCTEAGSISGIKGPYSAPRPAAMNVITSTILRKHDAHHNAHRRQAFNFPVTARFQITA